MRSVRQAFFRPSGLRSITIARNEPKKAVWRVEEILTAKDLFEEGSRMGLCVYSYGSAHGMEVVAFLGTLALCGLAMVRTWREQHRYV